MMLFRTHRQFFRLDVEPPLVSNGIDLHSYIQMVNTFVTMTLNYSVRRSDGVHVKQDTYVEVAHARSIFNVMVIKVIDTS